MFSEELQEEINKLVLDYYNNKISLEELLEFVFLKGSECENTER